jgi:hypothetical protein
MLDTLNFPDYLGPFVDVCEKFSFPYQVKRILKLLIYRRLAYFSGVRQ